MYIDIHTHKITNEKDVLQIQNVFLQDDNIVDEYFSIGLHPWHIVESNDISKLEYVIENKKLLAIGEVGLDKNIETSLLEQEIVLMEQLNISEQNKLPVILHIVKSYNEIVDLKLKGEYKETWIIHGFKKKIELANQLISHGFLLSFGASLMNEKSNSVEVIKHIDLSKVFLETDDKSEYSIKDIYKKVAEIRGISLDKLIKQIEINFKEVFKRYDG